MRVAVVGAGSIGRTLGAALVAAGEDVVFGLRDPAVDAPVGGAAAAQVGEAIADADADVVIVAIPGGAVPDFAADQAEAIGERVVIDATNDVGGGSMNHLDAWPPAARVFRAFNTLGWENFADPDFAGTRADLFYCGPEGDRAPVEAVIEAVGLRPVYVGGLDAAEVVDGVARLWFALALRQGRGRELAFKLLERA